MLLLSLLSIVGVFGVGGIQKEGELLLSLEKDGVFGVGGKLEDDGEGDMVRDVGGDEYSDMLLWR